MQAKYPTVRIRRRGFRNAPVDIRRKANVLADEYACGDCNVFAELRPTSYCGPDSAGARGAWTLQLSKYCTRSSLQIIESDR
jgi:hypothetical protein